MKKMIVVIGVLLGVALVLVLWSLGGSGSGSQAGSEKKEGSSFSLFGSGSDSDLPEGGFGSWDATPFYQEKAESLFQDGKWLSYSEILEKAESGEINLIYELWNLRSRCPEDMPIEQCNEMIKGFIKNQYPGGDGMALLKIFDKYLRYEVALRNFELPKDISDQEKLELIKKKRREFFTDSEAHLVFGLSEAKDEFRFGFKNFMEEAKKLPPDERMAAFEKYKKDVYGQYFQAEKKREVPFDNYETELYLRKDSLEKLSQSERGAKEKELQVKYFGKDGMARIQKVEAELAQEQKTEAELEKAESEYLRKHPELEGKDKQEALMKIREKYLGKDAAEEYSRRMEYERLMEEQRKNQF